MAMPLKEWSKQIKPIIDWANNNNEKMWFEYFMRDPARSVHMDPNYFYSPADGTILYSDVYKPAEKMVEIKGMHYTLQDIVGDNEFDETCLVIGIFMTYYDVHINRVPYGSTLIYKQLTPTLSYNRPMVFAESDLDSDNVTDLYKNMNYLKTNGRMLNTLNALDLNYKYYITQIADDQVNVITHFSTKQAQWFDQCQRFSFVRWGSQVELILPLDDRYAFKCVQPKLTHVEGGIDKLVEIIRK